MQNTLVPTLSTERIYSRNVILPFSIIHLAIHLNLSPKLCNSYVIAGGCLRDSVMNVEYQDMDLYIHRSLKKEAEDYIIHNYGYWDVEEDSELRKYTYQFCGCPVDVVFADNGFIDKYDFTINKFYLNRDFGVSSFAQSWFDLDNGILRPNNLDNPMSVFRGFRFAMRYNYRFTQDFEDTVVSLNHDNIYMGNEPGLLRQFVKCEREGNLPRLYSYLRRYGITLNGSTDYAEIYTYLKEKADKFDWVYNAPYEEEEDAG